VMYTVKNPLPYPVAYISSLQMIAGGSASLILSRIAGEWPHFQLDKLSQNSILGFVYLLVFGSIVGFLVFNWVSKQASPTLVSTYSYVNPIVALFLGWLVLGEKLNLNIVIAAGIIVVAVILITLGTNKKAS
jgi:drug/metabolite transporter (DMT)-like permease